MRHVLEIDVEKHFLFAPLGGETANDSLTGPQKELKKANSVIVIESYQSTNRKFWIGSRAILRIYWLNKDGWGLIGILSYLPAWLSDWIYPLFARHRHQFKLKMPTEPVPADRLLP